MTRAATLIALLAGVVLVVSGAVAGQGADLWVNPDGTPWKVIADRLRHRKVSPQQVQVVWIKQARRKDEDLHWAAVTQRRDELGLGRGQAGRGQPRVLCWRGP